MQVFAYVTDDFRRLQRPFLGGYGKPVLKLEGDGLTTAGVPVPRRAFSHPWLAQNGYLFRNLRAVELASALMDRSVAGRDAHRDPKPRRSELRTIVIEILEDLDSINRAKKSTLVLVHLPARDDYEGSDAADAWRAFMGPRR